MRCPLCTKWDQLKLTCDHLDGPCPIIPQGEESHTDAHVIMTYPTPEDTTSEDTHNPYGGEQAALSLTWFCPIYLYIFFDDADSCALGNGEYYQAIDGQPRKYKWILSTGIEYEMPCPVGTVFSIQKCQCIAFTPSTTIQPTSTAAPGNSLCGSEHFKFWKP